MRAALLALALMPKFTLFYWRDLPRHVDVDYLLYNSESVAIAHLEAEGRSVLCVNVWGVLGKIGEVGEDVKIADAIGAAEWLCDRLDDYHNRFTLTENANGVHYYEFTLTLSELIADWNFWKLVTR